MSKGMQVAGGATVIALLLGWYAATNLEAGASLTYYKNLDEFSHSEAAREGHHARVHGYVTAGSIVRDVASRSVRFTVQQDPPHAAGRASTVLPVVFGSLETPDMFKDGAEVVVEGRLQGEGPDARFRADKVLAKCPSKFEGRQTAQNVGG